MKVKCVLFDFDGTFADTSVDMCNALNIILEQKKFKTVNCQNLKTHISKGAAGIIEYASTVNGRPIDSSLMRAEFLQEYSQKCFVHTKMIPGIDLIIKKMDEMSIKWGIVTNKHSKYVKKILQGLSLEDRVQCLVTGDMLKEPKPSPEGLKLAMDMLNVKSSNTIYVGDDLRDIQAGKNASTLTIAANFGFVDSTEDINVWDANHIVNTPNELNNILLKYL